MVRKVIILVLAVVILADSLIKWYGYLFRKRSVTTSEVIVYLSHGTR